MRDLVQADSLEIQGSTVDLRPVVRDRMAKSRLRPLRYRYGIAVVAAILVAVTIGGGTALAVGTASGLIKIQWLRVPLLGQGKPLSGSVQDRQVVSLADAQTRVGFPIEVISGIDARLDRVEYQPPLLIEMNGQLAPHNTGAAVLYYTVGTVKLQVVEQLDAGGPGPLHLVLRGPSQSSIAVESIAGADRVVIRSSSGQIATIEWKTPSNVILTINIESPGGIDSSSAATLIQHLG